MNVPVKRTIVVTMLRVRIPRAHFYVVAKVDFLAMV